MVQSNVSIALERSTRRAMMTRVSEGAVSGDANHPDVLWCMSPFGLSTPRVPVLQPPDTSRWSRDQSYGSCSATLNSLALLRHVVRMSNCYHWLPCPLSGMQTAGTCIQQCYNHHGCTLLVRQPLPSSGPASSTEHQFCLGRAASFLFSPLS